jgi:hypothetical protein
MSTPLIPLDELPAGGAVLDTDLLLIERDTGINYTILGSTITSATTNVMTTLGDLIIGNTAGAPLRLAGNITTTPKYLKSLGTGSVANLETWAQVAYSDVNGAPSFSGGTWTPTDASGGSLTFTVTYATYRESNKICVLQLQLAFPATSDSNDILIGGLPKTVSATAVSSVGSIVVNATMLTSTLIPQLSSTGIFIYDNTNGARLTNVGLSGLTIYLTITYQTT